MDQEVLTDRTLFVPVDGARMATQLGLSEKGRARGQQNLPPATAAIPDEVEAAIVQQIATLRTGIVQDVQLRLQAINRAISRDRAAISTAALETDIAPIVTRLEQNARIDILDLEATREKLQEQRSDFLAWRQKRRLVRPAEESHSPISFFADLFLLAIVEGGLNLFFFMDNSEFGMLGAFLQAFLIAAANILVCTVAGFVLIKRVNSVFLLNKLLGFVSAAALFVCLPFAHLIVGFYRIARGESGAGSVPVSDTPVEAAGADLAVVSTPSSGTTATTGSDMWTAVEWALNREFHRLDEMSIIMCVVGIILGAYAIRKGYSFGDRYPDYTKNYWTYENRRLDYIEHLDEITSGMISDHTNASSKISNYFSALAGSLTSLKDYQDRKTELSVSLKNYESHLVQVGRTLLAEYRGANEAARSQPVPKTFSAEFVFTDPLFVGSNVVNPDLAAQLRHHEGVEDDAQRAAKAAQAAAANYQNRIQAAIAEAQKALQMGAGLREGAKQ